MNLQQTIEKVPLDVCIIWDTRVRICEIEIAGILFLQKIIDVLPVAKCRVGTWKLW